MLYLKSNILKINQLYTILLNISTIFFRFFSMHFRDFFKHFYFSSSINILILHSLTSFYKKRVRINLYYITNQFKLVIMKKIVNFALKIIEKQNLFFQKFFLYIQRIGYEKPKYV